ncbi:Flp family type IVb pilin [Arthrobacter sp. R1-13]
MARKSLRRLTALLSGLAVARRLPESETGATAVEYSLLVAFIASVIIAVVTTLGEQLLPGFETVIGGF